MAEYVFTSNESSSELKRLQMLERAFDDRTISVLLKAGIREGMRCLEIGPGAGSILKWMAEVVGPNGEAVGIDKNIEHMRHLDGQSIKLIEGNFQEIDFHEKFDLIHSRYVLIHNEDGADLISKLSGLLGSGGVLVVEEADFTTSKWIDPIYKESGNKVNDAGCELFRSMGLNPAYGMDVMVDIQRAGMEILKIVPNMHLEKGNSPVARMMGESISTLRSRYVGTGKCDDSDIDNYIDGTKDGRSLQVYYTTISVIAKNA